MASKIKENRAANVELLKGKIQELCQQTDLTYIDMSLLEGFSFFQIRKALKELKMGITTLTISGHMFKDEFKLKYEAEAAVNIPKIYFGPEGFNPARVGGGVCWVIIKF